MAVSESRLSEQGEGAIESHSPRGTNLLGWSLTTPWSKVSSRGRSLPDYSLNIGLGSHGDNRVTRAKVEVPNSAKKSEPLLHQSHDGSARQCLTH